MLYIYAKFREIISNGIKVMERTENDEPLTDGRTDGRTDTQKFRGYNIIPRKFLWRGIKRVKVSYSLVAVGAVGVDCLLYV